MLVYPTLMVSSTGWLSGIDPTDRAVSVLR